MVTAADTFRRLAMERGWSEHSQLEICLAFIEDHTGHAIRAATPHTIEAFCHELIAIEDAAKSPVVTCSTRNGVPQSPAIADLNTFFDRDMAKQLLPHLEQLQAYQALELPNPQSLGVGLLINPADYAKANALLGGEEESVVAPNTVIMGWYHTFVDEGEIAVIAITRGTTASHHFVDAFMILPDGQYPRYPNVTLPPMNSIDTPFVFPYPTGGSRVVRLMTRRLP